MEASVCCYCKESKPTSEFPRRNNNKSGIQPYCRSCSKEKRIERATKNRYEHAVSSARINGYGENKGKAWSLSKEQYYSIVNGKCDYCTLPVGPTGTGLDRIDPVKGYEVGNIVPCCAICNRARWDSFTVDEMKKYIGPAIKFVVLERISLGKPVRIDSSMKGRPRML